MMTAKRIPIPQEQISEFCRRWKVTELAVFGSAVGGNLTPESDVDILVSFAPDTQVGLFDLAQMQMELESLFGRPVDLVEKAGLQNPYRRREILRTSKVVYAAERT
ncbi:MAG: nucleotidyltransferase family protein [Bacteroidota bacterium]